MASKTISLDAEAYAALARKKRQPRASERAQRGVHLTMRTLREAAGKTPTEVAEASMIDQADISRLESRENLADCQVSILQRYIAALGGKLELVAAFGNKRIILSDVGQAGPSGDAAPTVGKSGELLTVKEIPIADLLELPVSERLRLVELLWDSIAAVPETLSIPDELKAELDRRLADFEADPEGGSSWEDVRSRILQRLQG